MEILNQENRNKSETFASLVNIRDVADSVNHVVSQLESLQEHCQYLMDDNDTHNVWKYDVEALQTAIDILKERDCL